MDGYTKPVLAILGRPNVGKSTLFNRLTKTRDALVADVPGVTRDVNVGVGRVGDAAYLVADTGGIDNAAKGNIGAQVTEQTLNTLAECDALLLVVDARDGLSGEDEAIGEAIRKMSIPVYLVVNKVDDENLELASVEFNRMGLGEPILIAALSGKGVHDLIARVTSGWVTEEAHPLDAEGTRIRVAIVGRPNVGKSTLVNRMIGEERMITADFPGTTRDSVAIDFDRRGQRFKLIDTAGLRRRSRVSDTVEKFSAVKALQAIDLAAVIVLVLDAQDAVTDQDAHLLGLVLESGRSVVIAVNKWDGLSQEKRDQIRRELDRKLKFIEYAERTFISALHGTAVGTLFANIEKAWRSSQLTVRTNIVTEILQSAVAAHPPPLIRGRRVKLRYAHFGGRNPPTIVIHGNQTKSLPAAYQRYLENFFRKAFKLVGTPVRMEFKQGGNPYADKRNPLTPRQVKRKRRMMKHVKQRH
ncbi:MAG: ribosome biogenesis GTPase Der [Gammaproteobacteria bacterium]|jgi:GTP-binding protein|nr:ribosome biogenesis GTPase Der [Gammaproteobacteria bacterium]